MKKVKKSEKRLTKIEKKKFEKLLADKNYRRRRPIRILMLKILFRLFGSFL